MRQAFVAVLLLSGSVAVAQSGSGDEVAAQLRQNVVRIQSQRQSGTENGFGFIVGERSGRLYIVTAYHVVADPDEVASESRAKARVTFYSDQGISYDAQVLGTHKPAPHDLAVLTVSTPQGFRWIHKCSAGSQQKRGTPVWSIARGGEWTVQGLAGAVASDRPTADQIIKLDGLKVSRGSSGGPVVAAAGIIGMILNDSADETQALAIDFIKSAFEDWNYPWDLGNGQQATTEGASIDARPTARDPRRRVPPDTREPGNDGLRSGHDPRTDRLMKVCFRISSLLLEAGKEENGAERFTEKILVRIDGKPLSPGIANFGNYNKTVCAPPLSVGRHDYNLDLTVYSFVPTPHDEGTMAAAGEFVVSDQVNENGFIISIERRNGRLVHTVTNREARRPQP